MTLRTLGGIDVLRPIEFTDALAWFQGRIGWEVRILVNHHGRFFGCGMQGILSRVETLPPDNSAIRVVVGAGEGLFLDPEDVTVSLGGGASGQSWLELQTGFGPIVTIEVAADPDD
ncbi:MAG: hypothetical protein R2725_16000 [Solirubrobacterales bacterium]